MWTNFKLIEYNLIYVNICIGIHISKRIMCNLTFIFYGTKKVRYVKFKNINPRSCIV